MSTSEDQKRYLMVEDNSKKPYQQPGLVEYGDILSLTLFGGGGDIDLASSKAFA